MRVAAAQGPQSNGNTHFHSPRKYTMNRNIVGGKWKQIRGRLKRSWGRLTHNPFNEFDGEQDLLNGKIQESYGRAETPGRKTRYDLRV
jgi:uncharacterized protein YjbJ (UPF0337 family)